MLTNSAIQSARRQRGSTDGLLSGAQQWADTGHLEKTDVTPHMDLIATTRSRVRMKGMAIGQLARATGTKTETIRYYERIGLLPRPARTGANYRNYGAADLARLSFIRRARSLGFSTDQVSALLELADCNERSCEAVDALAQQNLATIESKIADLTALGRELSDLIGQCRHGTIGECRILDALAPRPPSAAVEDQSRSAR